MLNMNEVTTLLTGLLEILGISGGIIATTIIPYLLYRFQRRLFWNIVYSVKRIVLWPFKMVWKGFKKLVKMPFRAMKRRAYRA